MGRPWVTPDARSTRAVGTAPSRANVARAVSSSSAAVSWSPSARQARPIRHPARAASRAPRAPATSPFRVAARSTLPRLPARHQAPHPWHMPPSQRRRHRRGRDHLEFAHRGPGPIALADREGDLHVGGQQAARRSVCVDSPVARRIAAAAESPLPCSGAAGQGRAAVRIQPVRLAEGILGRGESPAGDASRPARTGLAADELVELARGVRCGGPPRSPHGRPPGTAQLMQLCAVHEAEAEVLLHLRLTFAPSGQGPRSTRVRGPRRTRRDSTRSCCSKRSR